MKKSKEPKSVDPMVSESLPELGWDRVVEPGAYVEVGTGDLFRIPREALLADGTLMIQKESRGASRLVQISRDPFVTTREARLRCTQHNIEPNF